MSLAIDTATITEVLLAGGWHTVENQSFEIDAYELGNRYDGSFERDHGSGAGFRFTCLDQYGGETTIAGPISSVLAVRTA